MMRLVATEIAGVLIVESTLFRDARGSFVRFFCARDLEDVLGERRIVQVNHSLTRLVGAIRGFHYQPPPHAEMKFVRCLKGRVWDVILDLRKGSSTFLKWHAQELSGEGGHMIVVPEGCAHGFQVLQENSEMLYLHTEFFNPEADSRVCYNDPLLKIKWPLPVTEITAADREQASLPQDFLGFDV
jgi:dTDP-4-dehydrorhamnose 3,5-epimerase